MVGRQTKNYSTSKQRNDYTGRQAKSYTVRQAKSYAGKRGNDVNQTTSTQVNFSIKVNISYKRLVSSFYSGRRWSSINYSLWLPYYKWSVDDNCNVILAYLYLLPGWPSVILPMPRVAGNDFLLNCVPSCLVVVFLYLLGLASIQSSRQVGPLSRQW